MLEVGRTFVLQVQGSMLDFLVARGGGVFSSPCWSSESSRNTMFRNVRLSISPVDNVSMLSSPFVDGKGVVVGSEEYVGVLGVER